MKVVSKQKQSSQGGSSLLNMYYQQMHSQKDQVRSSVKATGKGKLMPQQQYEMKQRQQIQSVLQDFESTSKFNREQMKSFNSPKHLQATHPDKNQISLVFNNAAHKQQLNSSRR